MRVGDRVKLVAEPVRWSQAFSVVGREGRVTLLCEEGFVLVELDRESREDPLLRVKVEERALVKLESRRP